MNRFRKSKMSYLSIEMGIQRIDENDKITKSQKYFMTHKISQMTIYTIPN